MVETSAQARRLVITIDGPAGAGKSTTARALAQRLGYTYFDTGALYRAIAWKVKTAGITYSNVETMKKFLSTIDFRVSLDGGKTTTIIDSQDVTPFLRNPEVTRLASSIAAIPQVRDWLLPIQQRLGQAGGIVAEGRDMGTRVFPNADTKFFLEANLETRTARRYRETFNAGQGGDKQEIRNQIEERDSRDRSRDVSPLMPAPDAMVIDSSSLTVHEVVNKMMELIPAHP